MVVRVKSKDGEIYAYRSDDPIEPLRRFKIDPNIHAIKILAGISNFFFPLENVFWIKVIEKED